MIRSGRVQIMVILSLLMLAMAAPKPAERWGLASLHPSDPQAYFLLAEEVADAATTELERRLAIRLYALAATLDARQWRVGALRGIIGLVEDESTVRALRSMLELSVDEPPRLLPGSRIVLGQTDRASVAAFDVLSEARAGRRLEARRRLQNIPGVRERLLVYQDDVPGGMQRLMDELATEDGGEQRRRMTDAELVSQLQVQLRLLGGREDSWSATLMAWRGRPMQRLESHDLGALLGLDLDRRVWRGDRWRPLEIVEDPPGDADDQ